VNAPAPRPAASPFLIACVLLLASVASLRQVADVDYWWQLATGAAINAGGIPTVDHFTHTRAGTPRLEYSWAYCLALHHVVEVAGVETAVVLKSLAIVAAFGLVASAAARAGSPLLAWSAAAAAVLASSQRFGLRPEAFSLLFLAAVIAAVVAARAGRRGAAFIPPIVQLAWINIHSLAALGPLLVSLWAVVEVLRPAPGRRPTTRIALASAGATWLATLANPYGVGILRVPYDQLRTLLADGADLWTLATIAVAIPLLTIAASRPRRPAGIAADAPPTDAVRALRRGGLALAILGAAALAFPDAREQVVGALQALDGNCIAGDKTVAELASPYVLGGFTALTFFHLLTLAALTSVLLNPDRPSALWLALALSQFLLAAVAVRNVPLFAIAAVPLIAVNASRSWLAACTRPRTRIQLGHALTAAVATLCLFQVREFATDRFHLRQGDASRFGLGVDTTSVPGRAADALLASGTRALLFNEYAFGGYLLQRGIPVFADSRGVGGIIDDYLAIATTPGRFAEHAARHDLRALIVGVDRAPLIAAALRAGWRVVAFDSCGVLLLHPDEAPGTPTLDVSSAVIEAAAALASLGPHRPFDSLGPFDRVESPWPLMRLAVLCSMLGLDREAAECLRRAVDAYPPIRAVSTSPVNDPSATPSGGR